MGDVLWFVLAAILIWRDLWGAADRADIRRALRELEDTDLRDIAAKAQEKEK